MMKLYRTFSILALLFVMTVPQAGCDREKIIAQIEQTEAATREVIVAKDRVDGIIVQLQTGAITAETAVEQFAAFLPPEWSEKIRSTSKTVQETLVAAAQVSVALGEKAEVFLERLEKFKGDLQDVKDGESIALAVISGVAGIFGVGGVVGPIVGIIANRRGQATGAATVSKVIAAGRKADVSLDNSFRSGPASELMSSMLDQTPAIADAVRANKTE